MPEASSVATVGQPDVTKLTPEAAAIWNALQKNATVTTDGMQLSFTTPNLLYKSKAHCLEIQKENGLSDGQAEQVCSIMGKGMGFNSRQQSDFSFDYANITMDDRWVKIPVQMSIQGVHNGALKTAEELRKAEPFYENLPICITHPRHAVDSLSLIHGVVRNVRIDGPNAAVKGTAYLFRNTNELKAMGHDEASIRAHAGLVDGISKGARLGGSLGYFHSTISENGTYEGQGFNRREINLKPDHFAVVDRGASPWEVGTGFGSEAAKNEAFAENYPICSDCGNKMGGGLCPKCGGKKPLKPYDSNVQLICPKCKGHSVSIGADKADLSCSDGNCGFKAVRKNEAKLDCPDCKSASVVWDAGRGGHYCTGGECNFSASEKAKNVDTPHAETAKLGRPCPQCKTEYAEEGPMCGNCSTNLAKNGIECKQCGKSAQYNVTLDAWRCKGCGHTMQSNGEGHAPDKNSNGMASTDGNPAIPPVPGSEVVEGAPEERDVEAGTPAPPPRLSQPCPECGSLCISKCGFCGWDAEKPIEPEVEKNDDPQSTEFPEAHKSEQDEAKSVRDTSVRHGVGLPEPEENAASGLLCGWCQTATAIGKQSHEGCHGGPCSCKCDAERPAHPVCDSCKKEPAAWHIGLDPKMFGDPDTRRKVCNSCSIDGGRTTKVKMPGAWHAKNQYALNADWKCRNPSCPSSKKGPYPMKRGSDGKLYPGNSHPHCKCRAPDMGFRENDLLDYGNCKCGKKATVALSYTTPMCAECYAGPGHWDYAGNDISMNAWDLVQEFPSKSNPEKSYQVKREQASGILGCSCMAWRFQKKPAAERACQHTLSIKPMPRTPEEAQNAVCDYCDNEAEEYESRHASEELRQVMDTNADEHLKPVPEQVRPDYSLPVIDTEFIHDDVEEEKRETPAHEAHEIEVALIHGRLPKAVSQVESTPQIPPYAQGTPTASKPNYTVPDGQGRGVSANALFRHLPLSNLETHHEKVVTLLKDNHGDPDLHAYAYKLGEEIQRRKVQKAKASKNEELEVELNAGYVKCSICKGSGDCKHCDGMVDESECDETYHGTDGACLNCSGSGKEPDTYGNPQKA